jgi:hypothetical protein
MGEIADLIVDGDICQMCMCELGPGDGYPRSCASCQRPTFTTPKKAKTTCPICKKRVALEGLAQHTKAVHERNPHDL